MGFVLKVVRRQLSSFPTVKFLLISGALGTLMPSLAQAYGLRNFRQLEAHFAQATRVPSSIYNIRYVAGNVQAGLSSNSDIMNLNGTYIRSASQLAAAYCGEFIKAESKLSDEQRRCHTGVDFTLPPRLQPDSTLAAVANKYAYYFLGREATEVEMQHLRLAGQDILADIGESPASSQRWYSAMCTLVAASLDSLLIKY